MLLAFGIRKVEVSRVLKLSRPTPQTEHMSLEKLRTSVLASVTVEVFPALP
jgi:hypothetical protein